MNTGKNYDVYFARGHGVEKNPGNINYRELIVQYSQEYKTSTSTNNDKNRITNAIISNIQQMGGTFYHQPKGSEGFEWEELEEAKALQKKVKQSLRDSRAVSSSFNYRGGYAAAECDESKEEMGCDQYYEFVPFQYSSSNEKQSQNEVHQSSINIEDLMQESMGTICCGMQSVSMMDFNFSRNKVMSV